MFLSACDRQCDALFATRAIPLKPGATDLLQIIARLGLPLGLATSSRRGPAERKLAMGGIAQWFSAVVTQDDAARAKPAPIPIFWPPNGWAPYRPADWPLRTAKQAHITRMPPE